MIETIVPAGYLPERTSHQVIVDERGNVTIDGSPAENFPLYDVPNREAQVAFQKVDADTGQPLEGAVFALPNGVVAISGSDGMVDFGAFGPGTYILQELAAPQGYTAVKTEFIVVVTAEGAVFIDETPIENFAAKNARVPDPSQRPTIDTVIEDAIIITGRGVPGSEIAMTLPDGTVVTTTVNGAGVWVAAVPQGINLLAGQIIYATQTEIGHGPSEEASAVVQARS